MKKLACFLAPAALIVVFATSSHAQSQTAPKTDSATTPKADSAATTATPKVQAPAATPSDRTAATPNSSASSPTRKSTLSRRSRRIPPPPPLTTRHAKSATNKGHLGVVTDNATDLDAYGRVDTVGKHVPFYPSTRGSNPTKSSQSSAYRKGMRPKSTAPR
jgi:hypothetical protein